MRNTTIDWSATDSSRQAAIDRLHEIIDANDQKAIKRELRYLWKIAYTSLVLENASVSEVAEWHAKDRQLSSWIGGFLEFTAGVQSPEIFRKWSAISAIAGALERKAWIRSQGSDLYPNLYVFLVGPPGSGKTRALDICESVWRSLDTHKIAETSLTKAALVDRLAESSRIIRHPIQVEFNALLIASKELGALIPEYDPDFLNALTYFYDGIKYDEKRRYGKNNGEPLTIERPLINLIGCTTPSYLLGTMPPFAWEQGFLSRVIIVYSDIIDIVPLDLADEASGINEPLLRALTADMKTIGERCGRLKFTKPALEYVEHWHITGQNPKPNHPRLLNYSTRRIVHFLKLCMVAAVDRGVENIDLVDCQAAMDWMIEAEAHMPDMFVAMQSGGDAQVINECWHYILTHNARHAEGCPIHVVYEFLRGRTSSYNVQKMYEVMLASAMISVKQVGNVPLAFAKPR